MKKTHKTTSVLLVLFSMAIISLTNYNDACASSQNKEVFETFTDNFNPEQHKVCGTCPAAKGCETGKGATAPPLLRIGIMILWS